MKAYDLNPAGKRCERNLMKPFWNEVRHLFSETEPALLERPVAEVAFVGRSNSGKSSLINAVCEQPKLARVSKTPGETRRINVYGTPRYRWLVDLPGYGYAVGPASSRKGWMDMIEGYLTGRPSLCCVFLLVDAKIGPTPLDHQMALWLQAQALPFRILANKADQVKPSQLRVQQQRIAASLNIAPPMLSWISAKQGTGIAALQAEIARLLTQTSV
jgi:GTP-binding protein